MEEIKSLTSINELTNNLDEIASARDKSRQEEGRTVSGKKSDDSLDTTIDLTKADDDPNGNLSIARVLLIYFNLSCSFYAYFFHFEIIVVYLDNFIVF